MTQRIFDIKNKKDYADLWDILPDDIIKMTPSKAPNYFYGWYNDGNIAIYMLKINWHDKKAITRPKNYENMLGCVGWFSFHKNTKKDDMIFGILDAYNKNDNLGRCFYCHCDTWYKYFFPAKKCDVKIYGVDKDE